MESISSFFQGVSDRTQDALLSLSGVRRQTATTYLQSFLARDWSNENVLEPVNVDGEVYVYTDGPGGVTWDFGRVLKDASSKNVMQRGVVVALIAGGDNERFFFQTLTSRSYGEGFLDEKGKDLSFQQVDTMSFGVLVLSKLSGKVIRHEQRSDPPKTV
jgi:hypothetical protein